jgi:hypothetical protein
MTVRRLVPLLAALVALGAAGCGFGAGGSTGDVTLTVTRDFGGQSLHEGVDQQKASEGDTVMRLLERKYDVKTRFGGGFVQTIDGVSGGRENGHRADWFYYVNGIEASVGAADRTLSPGDVVQWDYRRWDATPHIPAIVGAYPEPFVRGSGGKRFPVLVECSAPNSDACKTVQDRLAKAGALTSSGVLGDSAAPKTVHVVVAPWTALQSLGGVVGSLKRGPAASGVFARFGSSGNSLALLDQFGHTVRQAPPGTGLVAATAGEGSAPVWIVTGLGQAAVDRAADSLDTATLHNAFAVAVTPEGKVALPVAGK